MIDENKVTQANELIEQQGQDVEDIDALFGDLKQQAVAVDEGVDRVKALAKTKLKAFNMRRFTLRADTIGTTYLQGLPPKATMQQWLEGNKLPVPDLIETLVTDGVLRHRAPKKIRESIPRGAQEAYIQRCLGGDHGKDMAHYAAGLMKLHNLQITELYPKTTEADQKSFTGALFNEGLVEYVTTVRGLLDELEAECPEGMCLVNLLRPTTTIQKAEDEWLGWAKANNLPVEDYVETVELQEL